MVEIGDVVTVQQDGRQGRGGARRPGTRPAHRELDRALDLDDHRQDGAGRLPSHAPLVGPGRAASGKPDYPSGK